jgi:hypothetical protein
MPARPSPRPGASNAEWDVYAIAAAPVPARVTAAGRALRAFRIGPLAVIAGRPRNDSVPIEESLRDQHAVVVDLADRFDPLLPARFGSRMTKERIDATVRPAIDILVSALDHVRGCRQMTVRLIGRASASHADSGRVSTGTAYLARRRAAAHEVPREAAPLIAAVASMVRDQRIQAGRGEIRATIFHLVGKPDVDRYRAAANAAVRGLHPWNALVTGPWPPFAFAPELPA